MVNLEILIRNGWSHIEYPQWEFLITVIRYALSGKLSNESDNLSVKSATPTEYLLGYTK